MTCYGDNYCVIGIYMPELPGLEIQVNVASHLLNCKSWGERPAFHV